LGERQPEAPTHLRRQGGPSASFNDTIRADHMTALAFAFLWPTCVCSCSYDNVLVRNAPIDVRNSPLTAGAERGGDRSATASVFTGPDSPSPCLPCEIHMPNMLNLRISRALFRRGHQIIFMVFNPVYLLEVKPVHL